MEIRVEKNLNSKLGEIDFNDIPFGKHLSDHMFICNYKNGSWQDPRVVPYGPLNIEPSCMVFHYAQTIFEGLKAYRGKDDHIFLFRSDQNQARFNKSAKRIDMPELPEGLFIEGCKALLKEDKPWIPSGLGKSYYLRPFMIANENAISAHPSSEFMFMIIGGPVGAYYDKPVKVKIADFFSRAANGGVGFAKTGGNYAGQFYPTKLAEQEGYNQIIWTDDTTHQHLEEAGTMNLMFRLGDTLVTAPTSERILDGVTRKSILQLAGDMGIKTEIRNITVGEIIEAHEKGELKEAFGVGTAAVVSLISGIGYKEKLMDIPDQDNPYSSRIKEAIFKIQYGLDKDPYGWRQEVQI